MTQPQIEAEVTKAKALASVNAERIRRETERRAQAAIVRVTKGASHKMHSRHIYFCKSGSGKIGAEPVRYCTTIHLEDGDSAIVTASVRCLGGTGRLSEPTP